MADKIIVVSLPTDAKDEPSMVLTWNGTAVTYTHTRSAALRIPEANVPSTITAIGAVDSAFASGNPHGADPEVS